MFQFQVQNRCENPSLEDYRENADIVETDSERLIVLVNDLSLLLSAAMGNETLDEISPY